MIHLPIMPRVAYDDVVDGIRGMKMVNEDEHWYSAK
jgi:hypothetical protein